MVALSLTGNEWIHLHTYVSPAGHGIRILDEETGTTGRIIRLGTGAALLPVRTGLSFTMDRAGFQFTKAPARARRRPGQVPSRAPPSQMRRCPVMKVLPTRKAIASATSSARPMRPTGVCAANLAKAAAF